MIIDTLSVGNLRERIAIGKDSPVRDNNTGEMVPHYSVYKNIWAAANVVMGKETEVAQRIVVNVAVIFLVRYRTDFDETMSVTWRGRVYQIEFIETSDDKGYMHLHTTLQQ